MQAIRELLNEHDYDELIEMKRELQEQLDTWQNKYEVDSPDELYDCAVETDRAEATCNIAKTVSDWKHALYRLSIVEETIKNYRTYSRDETESA